jgi:hypothetical protein
MIELEACVATQSWVNREYGRSLHPCGAPVFRIREVGVARQTQGPELNDELGGYYGVEG